MTEFGKEYGGGLYALCAEEKLEETVLSQLNVLKQTFRENGDFVCLLGNMSLSREERVSIVDAALAGSVHQYVLNFLRILVERGAVHEFPECVSAYRENYNRDHRVAAASVTTARPLTDAQRAQLAGKLKKMTGKEILLREKVDPSVMGGVLLELEGKRYDNTLRQRLAAIRKTMAEES